MFKSNTNCCLAVHQIGEQIHHICNSITEYLSYFSCNDILLEIHMHLWCVRIHCFPNTTRRNQGGLNPVIGLTTLLNHVLIVVYQQLAPNNNSTSTCINNNIYLIVNYPVCPINYIQYSYLCFDNSQVINDKPHKWRVTRTRTTKCIQKRHKNWDLLFKKYG